MRVRSSVAAMVVLVVASACFAAAANSQSSGTSLGKELVGTWILVSSEQTSTDGTKLLPYGQSPKGTLMLDASGHFAQIFVRDDLPKLDRRNDGTPEQLRAIVDGSLSIYGTYTVDEATKTVNMHYEASSFALFDDTDAKRTVALKGDELTTVNYATSRYTKAESTFRRAH